jgi:cholesterol transport system auxiliary component
MSRRFSGLLPLGAVIMGLGLGLGGCSLLTTPDPVQTYRFGALANAGDAELSVAARPVTVSLRRVAFPEASRGDRVLGVTGTEVAYIKGARWISPAETLFEASLRAAFSDRQGPVRLLDDRDAGTGDRHLQLEVTAFEARYSVPGGLPDIVITARAKLTALPGGTESAERTFRVVQPASENRIASIVEAFDTAVVLLNAQVVDWTGTAVPKR